MSSIVHQLTKRMLIRPPSWVCSNTMYETLTGSIAYGVSGASSDWDVVGFCIPSKEMIFPHLAGEIPGFGRQIKRFENYVQHHIKDNDSGREYDLKIHSIVKFFALAMENNADVIDTLFTSQELVLHSTKVANMVRDKRRMFLHKGCWHKFKGYAYNQLHHMKSRKAEPGSKREALVQQYGFDVKFAYHTVRLLYEAEQILTTGDLDLRRDAEHLKAIRRGDVSMDEIIRWAAEKEAVLEKVYHESKIPYGPDEPAVRKLLMECLEEHYGCLDACVVNPDAAVVALREVAAVIENNRHLLKV